MQKNIGAFLSTLAAVIVGLPIANTIMPTNSPAQAETSASVLGACVEPAAAGDGGEVLGASTTVTPDNALVDVDVDADVNDVADVETGDINVLSNNDVSVLNGNSIGNGNEVLSDNANDLVDFTKL